MASGNEAKTAVAISGGVDSSLAAALLARRCEVVALHFTIFDLPGLAGEVRARGERHLESARAAAAELEIPLEVVEAGGRFEELVALFCSEYDAGRTPNPCVACNATIKWPLFLEAASRLGADRVATGHYARIERHGGGFHLLGGREREKDQTYFLHRLRQDQLARTVFPLSDRTKEDVREEAARLCLPTAESRESQEICFVPSGGYAELISERGPERLTPGEVVDTEGGVLGRHEGYQLYTIGQRRGLGIALGEPAYVVRIDAGTARITLGGEKELESAGLVAENVNWIAGEAPPGHFRALVKVRYNDPGTPALVTPGGDSAEVEFDRPVRAVTAGQAAAFYRGEEVLGGGWIA